MAKSNRGDDEEVGGWWLPKDWENLSKCDGLVHLEDDLGDVHVAICEQRHSYDSADFFGHQIEKRKVGIEIQTRRASDRYADRFKPEDYVRSLIARINSKAARVVSERLTGKRGIPPEAKEAFQIRDRVRAELEKLIPESSRPSRPAGALYDLVTGGGDSWEEWRRADQDWSARRRQAILALWEKHTGGSRVERVSGPRELPLPEVPEGDEVPF